MGTPVSHEHWVNFKYESIGKEIIDLMQCVLKSINTAVREVNSEMSEGGIRYELRGYVTFEIETEPPRLGPSKLKFSVENTSDISTLSTEWRE